MRDLADLVAALFPSRRERCGTGRRRLFQSKLPFEVRYLLLQLLGILQPCPLDALLEIRAQPFDLLGR